MSLSKYLLSVLLLSGCMSFNSSKHEIVAWQDCENKWKVKDVYTITSNAPFMDCPKFAIENGAPFIGVLWIVGFPTLACTFSNENTAIIILSPNLPEWIVEHERDHVKGMSHPVLLPFLRKEPCLK